MCAQSWSTTKVDFPSLTSPKAGSPAFCEQVIDEDGVVLAVVDVPVICSDKFQQFLFFFVKVPQLQFIDRVAQVQNRRDSTGPVLGEGG